MECREVREYLPAAVDEAEAWLPPEVNAHLRTCESCSADLERYRRLAGDLAVAAEQPFEAPAWLLGGLIETVSQRAERLAAIRETRERLSDPRVVVAGAVLAAGVAGALMVRGYRRRRERSWRRRLRSALADA